MTSITKPGKAQIEVTRLGAWVIGILNTVMTIVVLAVAVSMLMDVPAGHTGARVFLIAIMLGVVVLYLFNLRRILKRRFPARVGFGYLPSSLLKIERVDD